MRISSQNWAVIWRTKEFGHAETLPIGTDWYRLVWIGTHWYGMVWTGTDWCRHYGLVWIDADWYGLVRIGHGSVRTAQYLATVKL